MKHVYVFNRVCNIGIFLLLYMHLSIWGSMSMPSKSSKVERLTAQTRFLFSWEMSLDEPSNYIMIKTKIMKYFRKQGCDLDLLNLRAEKRRS